MAIIDVNEQNFEKEITKFKGFAIVDCNAYWCGPCKMFEPIFEEVSNKYKSVKFASLNVDKNENLSARLEVNSIPIILFFKNGREIYRHIGFASKDIFEKMIKEIGI